MLQFFRRRGRDAAHAHHGPAEPLYTLRVNDERLIRAAVGLGDWILARNDISRSQRKAITALQDALRSLPGTPPPIIAEYGFHVRHESTIGKGLYRAWRVALSPSGIEIYSVYSPDEKIEFEDKVAHELNYWQRPFRPSTHDGYYYDEWIEEVADPDLFRRDGGIFGVMAQLEMGEY